MAVRRLKPFRALGDRHQQAGILDHLGDAYSAFGNNAAARCTWKQALDILKDLHHTDTDHLRDKLQAVSTTSGTRTPVPHSP